MPKQTQSLNSNDSLNIDPDLISFTVQDINLLDSTSSTASNTPFSMSTTDRTFDDDSITDVDEEPAIDVQPTVNHPSMKIRQSNNNNLLALLSGTQYSKKVESRLKSKEKRSEEPESSISELSSSFSDVSSTLLVKEHNLIELERKFHSDNVRTMSAKSVLSKEKIPKLVDGSKDIKSIEAKIYGNSSAINARDIFKSLKPKIHKKSLTVNLKIDSQRLEEIKNPFKTRGNGPKLSSNNNNLLSMLQGPRATKKVSFKVDPVKLKEVARQLNNPLFSRGTGHINGAKDVTSVFQSMMQNASSEAKLTKLQKLKKLDPPTLKKDQFHICIDEDLGFCNDKLMTLVPRRKSAITEAIEMTLDDTQFVYNQASRQKPISLYAKKELLLDDINQHILSKLPHINDYPVLNRIYTDFIGRDHQCTTGWSHHFQPQATKDLFTVKNNQTYIQNWLTSAFERLKVQSLKKPRSAQVKQQKKRTALDGFVIEDFDFDDSFETESVFTPLLILHGSVGAGKSTAVYAAMKELCGYVHEINSGQSRSRKDTFNQLKELSTTHLVSQRNNLSEREFQKGIILLEDCDILFEQDKGFWSMVYDIVNISKRPIILTCSDIDRIPNNLYQLAMKENAILSLDVRTKESDKELRDYIWLCCLSKGYDVNEEVIRDLIDETSSEDHHDLRKLFVEIEMICGRPEIGSLNPTSTNLIYVEYQKQPSFQGLSGLNELSDSLEAYSVGDVISANTKSAFNHEIPINELVDVYVISDESQLQQPTISYELNIGEALQQIPGIKQTIPHERYAFNDLKGEVKQFISSRTKKMTRAAIELQLTRSMTRSRSTPNYDFNLGTTGISEVSSLHSLTTTPYVLELAPFCRLWKTFQKALDTAEKKSMENNVSVKAFLNWRQFQHENTRYLDSFLRTYVLDL